MLPKIHQHINNSVTHRARRRERTGVEPVRPYRAPAAEGAVDAAGDPDGEATESARERPPRLGLGDEMHVIVLHGELNDTKIRARRRDERAAHEWEYAGSAEAADGFHGPQRDVDRVRSDVGRPLAVRYARPAARHALAPRAGLRSAGGGHAP